MTELEKVEKLREKADVTFAEAKEALDNAGGDILEALIWLERQGKAIVPAGGGFFSGAGTQTGERQYHADAGRQNTAYKGESFSAAMKRFGRFCLRMLDKGNTNFLDATSKGGEHMFSCPVTVLIILLVFFFWITVPLFILSLFLGFRYQFRGDDLGSSSVNRVMDGAVNVVEDVKKSFADSRNNKEESSDHN